MASVPERPFIICVMASKVTKALTQPVPRRWIKWLVLAGIALAVLVLNPWFGVTGYSYGRLRCARRSRARGG